MNLLHSTTYFMSAVDPGQLPRCLAEVTFVGRSNVGKSSMINALCGNRGMAVVSRKPGRTRAINVFSAVIGRWLVDLPGYGFASGRVDERRAWPSMIEEYLMDRPTMRMVFLVIDAHVGPTPLDISMMEWLRFNDLPVSVIANKTDKVSPADLDASRRSAAGKLSVPPDDIFWISAAKGDGIPRLAAIITRHIGLK